MTNNPKSNPNRRRTSNRRPPNKSAASQSKQPTQPAETQADASVNNKQTSTSKPTSARKSTRKSSSRKRGSSTKSQANAVNPKAASQETSSVQPSKQKSESKPKSSSKGTSRKPQRYQSKKAPDQVPSKPAIHQSRQRHPQATSQKDTAPPEPVQQSHSKQKSERIPGEVFRMVFAQEESYYIAAVAEGQRLTDFWIEEDQPVDYGTTGNIYRGVVSRVLPSLNAAFVNIGLEKDGFLSFDDLGPIIKQSPSRNKNKKAKDISDVLRQGDKVLIQMAKESIGEKGPSMTGKISIPGRFLVFMPYTDVIRMSRQMDDQDKNRFRKIVENNLNMEGGWIFRTASVGRDVEEIQNDIDYLERIWRRVQRGFEAGDDPKLLHEELDILERSMRDNFQKEMDEIVVDHPRLRSRVASFLKVIAPNIDPNRMIRFKDKKEQSIWSECGLVEDVDQLFRNNITMTSGGFIIIEEMETLTAIDVNSGKNVKGKSQDETILATNLEAAKEIPRQLRLRQIGGIIVIDFIDMYSKKDQQRVMQTLLDEFEKDRTPTDVQEFTDLGLIQVTRQRLGKSLTKRLTYQCPHCHGSGRRPLIALT